MGLCLFFSCSDSDDPAPGSVVKLPGKITIFNEDGEGKHHYYNFSYDNENRIIQYILDDNYGRSIFKFSYDSDGSLKTVIEANNNRPSDTMLYTFQYKPGEIIEADVYKKGNKIEYTGTRIHKVNDKGQMTISYFGLPYEAKYVYDGAGNITQMADADNKYGINYLVYDNKRGILSQVKTSHWICMVFASELEFLMGYFVNNCSRVEDFGEVPGIYDVNLKYDNDDYLYQVYYDGELASLIDYITK